MFSNVSLSSPTHKFALMFVGSPLLYSIHIIIAISSALVVHVQYYYCIANTVDSLAPMYKACYLPHSDPGEPLLTTPFVLVLNLAYNRHRAFCGVHELWEALINKTSCCAASARYVEVSHKRNNRLFMYTYIPHTYISAAVKHNCYFGLIFDNELVVSNNYSMVSPLT